MAAREGSPGETAHRSEDQRQRVGETRDEDDRRPGGQAEVVGEKKPLRLESIATKTATAISAPMPTAQNRAAAAGRIMMPTAISVPSA